MRDMKEKIQKNKLIKSSKGITLIALIITIIVLLILAGITVATLTGDNGIVTKAGEAKTASEDAKIEEEIQLAFIENEKHKSANLKKDMKDIIQPIFEKSYGSGKITLEKSGKNYKVKVNNTKIVYRVEPDGTVKKYEEMAPTDVYGKLVNGTLYLRPTQLNNEYTKINETDLCNIAKYFTASDIIKVVIEEPIAPNNNNKMFYQLSNLTKIENIEKLHTENSTDMTLMFAGCKALEKLDLSNFDTLNVKYMSSMFWVCDNLKELDISSFNTSKVLYMDNMFGYNNYIKELDVSNFDTSKVVSMNCMFFCYYSLTKLDVSHFDTSKVKSMKQMFCNCQSLTNQDLSNFNTSIVTDMDEMFLNCKSLKKLNLSNFDTSKVKSMKKMFSICQSLIELDLSNFNTKGVTSYDNMFKNVTARILLGENWNSAMTAESTSYSGTQWNT